MRVVGATLLVLGFVLSFSIDEWEALGLIPMGIGLILLTVAENQALALGLAETVWFERPANKRPALPSQNQLSAADEIPVSAEVLLLLERLNRSSRPR